MDYTHWWGTHLHWFWIVPIFFMFLFFFFMLPLMRRACGGRWESRKDSGWSWFDCCRPRQNPDASWQSETPPQILDRRYASGEITKEQYEQMMTDIKAGPSRSESGDNS